MNPIFKKRLKRKRILEGRHKCHGNVYSCHREHLRMPKKQEPVFKVEEAPEFGSEFKRKGFLRGIYENIKRFFHFG